MRSALRSFMAALILATLPAVLPAAPVQRPSKQYSIEQFMDTVAIRGASFSADETRLLFSSDRTGSYNVESMPLDGGQAAPMTASTADSTFAISYFPHDGRFLFTRDQGGNETTST